ncbi:putative 2-aminoethylphosphonate ABC transporter permease subunit [Plesiomonas sp.]|uniref:putative 2-aminoethylphosphonate ABC transporter permease subunit n=1 Tax=Plesiomonas sp. TaxID=2486279 RepID=UPI003F3D52FF
MSSMDSLPTNTSSQRSMSATRYSVWQQITRRWNGDKCAQLVLLILGIALLCGGLLLPVLSMLQKSLQNTDGAWVGFDNFRHYLTSANLGRTVGNTLMLGVSITLLVITVAFGYAYALTRTQMPCKSLFRLIGLIPLLMPSLLPAISLVYWFGNQGVAKGLLGEFSIYGPLGIIIGLGFWCFPHALMILITALSHSDARLYESARVLGSPAWRTFITVTLPTARYGLISAAITVFTLVICDFGVAKVIGGQFNVLATDIYRQVIGMQNFSLGAVASVLLLLPAIASFAIEHRVRSRMQEQSSSRAVPYQPSPHRLRDLLALLWCGLWAVLFLALVGMAVYGSLVQFWPYNLTLTFDHYAFESNSVYGWQPFTNTLQLGFFSAIFGTTVIVLLAWIQEKGQYFAPLRHLMHLLAMFSLAVPGIVLGLGYIFFFNTPGNPFHGLYGTLPLLMLSCVIHYYTVGHMTALTSLKQLPRELELVAVSLKLSQWRTFWRVTLPVCLPALLEIFIYLFVNAMTTTSAVIFLYSSDSILASIAVLNMEDSGDTASAAAMASLILLAATSIKLLQLFFSRTLLARTQRWRNA